MAERCGMELCPHWAGDGDVCPCAVFGLHPGDGHAAMPAPRPKRIQRKRQLGWRMPASAVYVGRPSRWGNPYILQQWGNVHRWLGWYVWRTEAVSDNFDTKTEAADYAVMLFRDAVMKGWGGFPWSAEIRAELAGKDLVCWCPLDQPCHADVLLEIANSGEAPHVQ